MEPKVKTEEELLAVKLGDIQEKQGELENRVRLLEIIAGKGASGVQEDTQQQTKKVIQINANGKKYICITQADVQVFKENNPGIEMETHTLELPAFIVDGYMNDSENKKQFTRKE